MTNSIIADYHVHSDFSSDGKATAEQMIEQAISLGLKKLCFTDHMDYDYRPVSNGYPFMFDIDDYMQKLSLMKQKYQADIEILTGIELGIQPHLQERLTDLVSSYDFDFVIGSSHVLDNTDPYFPEYWEGRTEEEGIHRYFQSIIDNCNTFDGFSVYGHIDYIVRYTPTSKAGTYIEYDYRKYSDILDEALKTILSLGKGIEINTAGFKYGLGHPHPKLEIIKRYKELGGEIITIGSDAHMPQHLCYNFESIPELLKSAGFNYYTVFVGGKPSFIKL